MSTIRAYQGYPLDREGRWVGITEDHQWVTGQGDDITPVGGWGKHPLAHMAGVQMLFVLLQVDADWKSLSRAQQRCLMDPGTRSTRPWRALTGKGLADDTGLTPRGMFLRLAHEWTQQRQAAA